MNGQQNLFAIILDQKFSSSSAFLYWLISGSYQKNAALNLIMISIDFFWSRWTTKEGIKSYDKYILTLIVQNTGGGS